MGRKRTGVRAASASSIEISFVYKGVRCRERLKLKPSPANLKRAQRHRAAVLDAIDKGTFDYAITFPDSKNAHRFENTDTVKHYLEKWLALIQPTLKASTTATHRRIINFQLVPQFGDLLLTEVTWPIVKAWLHEKDVTTKTLKNILSVFRSALDEAVEDELINHNPLVGRKVRGKPSMKHEEIDPFDHEERQAIIRAATGQEKNLIQFAFWTGLRISELCALDWGDVDWKKKTVRVSRALTQAADESEMPKTSAGIRDVRLLPEAFAAVVAQKPFTFLSDEEVFQNPRTGERWSGDVTVRARMWKRVLKKAGVRYRYPYQMRHTYASMMLMAGEPVMWVAQQMGHRDWAFTAKTYSRWIESDQPTAGNKAAQKWKMLS